MAKITILNICLLVLYVNAYAGSKNEYLQTTVDTSLTGSSATLTKVRQSGIVTGNTRPSELIRFSQTLKGIAYKYGSADPKKGFDCSGFITYVFNHFKIDVPRTSAGFTDQGREVPLSAVRPGDLILFTGTDSKIRKVGHMGIITQSGEQIVFIHSTSGKAYGVTETTLNTYYMGRFVKVIRVFNSLDQEGK
ncbi:C40 family peptidase [Chitinophaga rhizophila]|uniref:C40 family peptidase n=1 Tax=Chitinophaga rhizophila TaxID=2866212 RepID=A0ABS7G6M6_9BACT|nr:NlpC/P60 family protein [Chitinophaga rhizophila]MBW8683298.1 C40 family peptidase [Chitinophaga rhizophila]